MIGSTSGRCRLRLCSLVVTVLVLAACQSPRLDFPDWRLTVPEGTPLREYAPVPAEERAERIGLVEDLVLGVAEGDAAQAFYQITGIAVDAAGRIYVLERGNHRVQVFDAEGTFLRTLGREGEGPGEFQTPATAAVVSDVLVVLDTRTRRFSLWSLDGRHLGDQALAERRPSILAATDDGRLVGSYATYAADEESGVYALASFDTAGNELRTYFELPFDSAPAVRTGVYTLQTSAVPRDAPAFAASRSGDVYASPAGAYQVAAKRSDGSFRWALRVALGPEIFEPTPEQVDRVLSALRRMVPELQESQIDWPEYRPVIGRLEVDGRGNVYVFPWIDPLSEVGERPVDVYSPDGERLFTGLIADIGWRAAAGEFVYAVDSGPESANERVVRYRLVTPF